MDNCLSLPIKAGERDGSWSLSSNEKDELHGDNTDWDVANGVFFRSLCPQNYPLT